MILVTILALLLIAAAGAFFLSFPAMAVYATYHAATTGDIDSIGIAIGAWLLTLVMSGFLLDQFGNR